MATLMKHMECKICLSIFTNPKELTCGHVFCKLCLDDKIMFNGDGEGLIKCPVCKKESIIAKNTTTDDLPISLLIKDMVLDCHKERSLEEQKRLKNLKEQYEKAEYKMLFVEKFMRLGDQKGLVHLIDNVKNLAYMKGSDDMTIALYVAKYTDNVALLQSCIAHGADPQHVNRHGESLLHLAVAGRPNLQISDWVSSNYPNLLRRKDITGHTPFEDALYHDHYPPHVIEMLATKLSNEEVETSKRKIRKTKYIKYKWDGGLVYDFLT